MTFDDLSSGQRELLQALTGSSSAQLRKLWASPEARLREMAYERQQEKRLRRELFEIENAIKDFQTVALGSQRIHRDEEWIRIEILQSAQFMPRRYLYVATHGTEKEFAELTTKPAEKDKPWSLILQYLRATRSGRSDTENSRDHFLGYHVEPPDIVRDLFAKLVETVRKGGREVA